MSSDTDKVIFREAFSALRGVNDIDIGESRESFMSAVMKVTKAFIAADKANVDMSTADIGHIVASAMWADSQGELWNSEETSPYCIGGHGYVVFAKAVEIIRCVDRFRDDINTANSWELGIFLSEEREKEIERAFKLDDDIDI